jgi:hypothetical protein
MQSLHLERQQIGVSRARLRLTRWALLDWHCSRITRALWRRMIHAFSRGP